MRRRKINKNELSLFTNNNRSRKREHK